MIFWWAKMALANTQNPKKDPVYIHVYAAASSPSQKRTLKKKRNNTIEIIRQGKKESLRIRAGVHQLIKETKKRAR